MNKWDTPKNMTSVYMNYTGMLQTVAELGSFGWWEIIGPTGFQDVFFVNIVLVPYIYNASMIFKLEHKSQSFGQSSENS